MEHHAYYSEGPLSHFERYKEELRPFWANRFERFGIEDARALIEQASLKNAGNTTFLIAAAAITHEAQQALLKLFEEPQEGTTFVLLVPHGALISTLRSRMLAFPQSPAKKILGSPYPADRSPSLRQARPDHFPTGSAATFLKSDQKARSAEIAKLLEDDEDARERVREFLNSLEQALYSTLHTDKAKEPLRKALEDIAAVRSYVGDRSPSLKMLLEHLALSVPRV